MDAITQKIQSIFQRHFGIADKFTDSANIQSDLGADSLDMAELVVMVEDEFGIEISDEDVEKMQTIADVVKYVQQHTKPVSEL